MSLVEFYILLQQSKYNFDHIELSLLFCGNGTSYGCCSGSNFFTDKCSPSLRISQNCSYQISDQYLRYSTCMYNSTVCGSKSQTIYANQTTQRIQITTGKYVQSGQTCSYRIVQLDGAQLIVRLTQSNNATVYATVVDGQSYSSPVESSKQIAIIGSSRFQLQPTQTLMLNAVILDPKTTTFILETYTIGHEAYGLYLEYVAILVFASTFGGYLFLVITQKCRIVTERHDREINEYLQRKHLFRQFETEEIFKKNNFPIEEQQIQQNAPGPIIMGTYDKYLWNERHQVAARPVQQSAGGQSIMMSRSRHLPLQTEENRFTDGTNMESTLTIKVPNLAQQTPEDVTPQYKPSQNVTPMSNQTGGHLSLREDMELQGKTIEQRRAIFAQRLAAAQQQQRQDPSSRLTVLNTRRVQGTELQAEPMYDGDQYEFIVTFI